MDDTQTLLRQWIEAILAEKKWSKARLATEAGFPTSTITRLFHDDYKGSMNVATIAKIVRASGRPAPRNIGGIEAPPGFAEPQATLDISMSVETLPAGQSQWTCQTATLSAIGLMPGDQFILDQNITPINRDVIMLQKYDPQSGNAETMLRVFADGFAYTPNYLADGTPRIYLDNTAAVCMGVIVKSWRTRI